MLPDWTLSKLLAVASAIVAIPFSSACASQTTYAESTELRVSFEGEQYRQVEGEELGRLIRGKSLQQQTTLKISVGPEKFFPDGRYLFRSDRMPIEGSYTINNSAICVQWNSGRSFCRIFLSSESGLLVTLNWPNPRAATPVRVEVK